jgi:hypothetical protein
MASAWKLLYSFLGTPLVRRGREDELARALMGSIETGQAGLLLSLRNFAEGPVLEAVRRAKRDAGAVRTVRALCEQRAALEVEGGAGEAIGMGKKRRKTLERRRRRLTEQLGETEVKGRRRPNDAATIRRRRCPLPLQVRLRRRPERQLTRHPPTGRQPSRNQGGGLYDIYDSCADSTNETLNAVWPDRRTVWSIVFARDDLLGSLAGRALKLRGELRLRRLARARPAGTQPISAA